jgi:hypothetical protein
LCDGGCFVQLDARTCVIQSAPLQFVYNAAHNPDQSTPNASPINDSTPLITFTRLQNI